MKKFFLFFITAIFSLTGNSEIYHFDVNGDGEVTAADVTALYDFLLGNLSVEPVEGVYTINGVSFKMVEVQGGTFTMGETSEQLYVDYWDCESHPALPTHRVTVSGFYICQTEVTQELWQAVMGSNPSWFNGDSYGVNLQRPVERVSWNDCQEFISRLNQITGKHFRLPTEAEWEYAARGGNRSRHYTYAGSNDVNAVAWWDEACTHPVATKQPNELGLYDMSGNVDEWCQDWYGSYSSAEQTNPKGPASGTKRVYRGGSYVDEYDWYLCVSMRRGLSPSSNYSTMGFRLAL